MLITAMFIYKICLLSEWNSFQKNGVFAGSALDQKSGYIHLSLPRQLPRIFEKYFSDQRDVVFLKIPIEKIKKHSKWEPNSKGDLFLHLYGDLKLDHIEKMFTSLDGVLAEDPLKEAV